MAPKFVQHCELLQLPLLLLLLLQLQREFSTALLMASPQSTIPLPPLPCPLLSSRCDKNNRIGSVLS